MGSGNDVKDAFEDAKNKITDVIFDKLRNNFYGYILTSLFIFNLENLIIILKSKDAIEMTLIYIGVQKNFMWDFFWWPIIFGALAAILMPILTALYAIFIGVIQDIRNESSLVGSNLWRLLKDKIEAKKGLNAKKKETLEREVQTLNNTYSIVSDYLDSAGQQKDVLHQYLVKLSKIYVDIPTLSDKDKLSTFFDKLYSEGLLNDYPTNSKIISMVVEMSGQNTSPPEEASANS